MLLMCCLAYQSWTQDHPTSHLFPVMPLMFHAMQDKDNHKKNLLQLTTQKTH